MPLMPACETRRLPLLHQFLIPFRARKPLLAKATDFSASAFRQSSIRSVCVEGKIEVLDDLELGSSCLYVLNGEIPDVPLTWPSQV